jgi:hypothetical protein
MPTKMQQPAYLGHPGGSSQDMQMEIVINWNVAMHFQAFLNKG